MLLTDTAIKQAKPREKPFKLYDTDGLYIIITPSGGKWWRFKYRFGGKEKCLSFNTYPEVSLKQARRLRDEARVQVIAGIDPSAQRKQAKDQAAAQQQAEQDTFFNVANEWFRTYASSVTPKHAAKLRWYLEQKLFPVLGNKQVTAIMPADILDDVVRPIEQKGHNETAHKVMRLTGQVLTYAKITGKVNYNVASDLSKVMTPVKVTNFPAITDPKEIGVLLRDIDAYEEFFSVVYCLKILPYVFTRSSELRLAEWTEFNFEEALWRIPAVRMKMRKEHIVPLAHQVITLLKELQLHSGAGKYLFPSVRAKSAPISDAAPLAALRRLGYSKDKMTIHGFRSMASTRLNELGKRADVIEVQLAHKEPDGVRMAYNRAQYMEERKMLMQEWADYLDQLRQQV